MHIEKLLWLGGNRKQLSIFSHLSLVNMQPFYLQAFSVSSGSKQTIIPRQDDYDRTIGQRQVLSFYDAKAANFHYCECKL